MGYTLTWETLGSKRQHGQDIWRERMTIAGKYQAVGESSAKKRAQAAAAEAMIRSGVLEDFPAYMSVEAACRFASSTYIDDARFAFQRGAQETTQDERGCALINDMIPSACTTNND